MKVVRLDRLLANLGYGSRREVSALLAAGKVSLDDETVCDPGLRIGLERSLEARLALAGEPIDPLPPLTLVMHKPLGVVCGRAEAGRSLYDLLPERWRRRSPALSSIGRLDRDTTGLLLITDDGELLHRIISPRSQIAKTYEVELAGPLQGGEASLFASGTLLLDGERRPLAPARLHPLSPTCAQITIVEGRYHQVRRMFAATGNQVRRLHRRSLGALHLPGDLAPGAFRPMQPRELAAVFAG